MEEISSAPIIGVVADRGLHGGQPSQTVMEKYLEAVSLAGAVPLILPQGLADSPAALASAMAALDGILLPGSASNIEPHHYASRAADQDTQPEVHADSGRDRLAFALIDLSLASAMPLFGICRGMQELVVRTGGALHRRLFELSGFQEHREDEDKTLEVRYAPAHDVELIPGGLLCELFPETPRFWVNSLHGQGVSRLGEGVRIECRARDGLVEAISVASHPFALGVQWHPEWNSRDYDVSRRLFDTFIQHARAYRDASLERRSTPR
ncbi:gamma-glutamyl-gamma-aminobutyrate hydrolase [Halotalea alkalilenta]|uniref:gamma-glutamyl-gamma-aminobutyrate hydrolase n=1 Tax=Halotalea alkalilenta TaxID=376489 RepID=UPI0004855DE3|nr:gamma-glutamyl-gamma-aminobutyrate hydrolase [Halotalea alkalilenta]